MVVLVHGMMEPPEVWSGVLARLRDRYRCVVLDLPWNGRQGGFWGEILCSEDWLREALDAFQLQPDAWVAHSFGASTVLALLARDAAFDRVPVALISPFYKVSSQDVTWPLFQRYVNEFTDFVELSIRLRRRRAALDPDVLRRMTEAARDSFGCYVWMNFWQLFARMPFLPLRHLTQPVLVLSGDEDFSSPLADAQALRAALPNAALEVHRGCGHFLLSCREQESAVAIDRFLVRTCQAPEVFSAAA
ncbi:alpha/beta hydrolase [Cupriavidus basilensis]|uniref:Alpha/beta hydrolase n=1 Tax=Cupriavidus basilensis TaxID=68895 RepID=A0ABT6ASI5_9BURK|nr:alpha/beta hydrolase [Cupriavidus basilensis]MDF3835348.1 alpha/beta hydrolase [Cupriavidus basilensis]